MFVPHPDPLPHPSQHGKKAKARTSSKGAFTRESWAGPVAGPEGPPDSNVRPTGVHQEMRLQGSLGVAGGEGTGAGAVPDLDLEG